MATIHKLEGRAGKFGMFVQESVDVFDVFDRRRNMVRGGFDTLAKAVRFAKRYNA